MLTRNTIKRLHVKMHPSYWAYLNWVSNREMMKRNDMIEKMVMEYSINHPYPDQPRIDPTHSEGDYHAKQDINLWE